MAEPPEPRHPEEGGGADDPTHVPTSDEYDDFSEVGPDEFFEFPWEQADRDNEVSDLLHSGPVEISDEATPKEREATEVLNEWRNRVDREPLPPALDIDALIAEHERRKKAAEPPAPRKPDSGGTPTMIEEGAQILRNAAGNADTVRGMLNSAGESIRSGMAALQEAVGVVNQISGEVQNAAGGEEGATLGGLGQEAANAIDQLVEAVSMFDPDEAMGHIGQFFDAISQAAQKHSS